MKAGRLRLAWIVVIAIVVVIVSWRYVVNKHFHPVESKQAETQKRVAVRDLSQLQIKTPIAIYSSVQLFGRKLDDLYAEYICAEKKQKIEAIQRINFAECLKSLWLRKKKIAIENDTAAAVGFDLVSDYQDLAIAGKLTKVNIHQYIGKIDGVMRKIRTRIDWERVRKIKRLNDAELKLVKSIAWLFDGRDLVAYAMTEVLPSNDGGLNVEFMDFLLQNAGEEYVNAIPAVHDTKTSFGPLQFTEYALYESGGERRGASFLNPALPADLRIGGSVVSLRTTEDHYKAAMLFVIGNIADIVRLLNEKQLTTLSVKWMNNESDLLGYVAAAHHGPVKAHRAFKLWLDNGTKYYFKKSCTSAFQIYVVKTNNNRDALEAVRIR